MFTLSRKWKIIFNTLMVTICTSAFSEAMEETPHPETFKEVESLEIGGKNVEFPSLFALLDPQQPHGLNLHLVEKRAMILDREGVFYHTSTREDVTVDITNLRKSKKSSNYEELEKKLAVLNQTKSYINTQFPLIIQNKMNTIQDDSVTLTDKETAIKELKENCEKILKSIESIKALDLFQRSIETTENKILKILGSPHFRDRALTKDKLDKLPPL